MALERLRDVQARLATRGFVEDLVSEGAMLKVAGTGRCFAPTDLVVEEVARFEGPTDPSEEAILFALALPDGAPLGTYTVPYGPAASAEDAAIMDQLRVPGHDGP